MTKPRKTRRTKVTGFVVALMALLPVLILSAAESNSTLIDAVKAGNGQMVRALLKQRSDVNVQEPDGMTALHWAVQGNDLEITQLLIRAGASTKSASRYGVTPLSLAATNGNATIVEMLLKAGADANA